jgi:tRNA(Ile)-lysidine synthase
MGPGARKVTVVRPLLGVGRADTEAFCAARGIEPRHDVTNEDLSVPRNRIRRQVIGPLRSINPAVTTAIARLSTAARDDIDFLSSHVDTAWNEVATEEPGASATVSRAKFRKLHPALKRRVLIRMYLTVTGVAEGLALDHVEAMMSLAEGRSGASLDLPGGARFEVAYRSLNLRARGVAGPSESSCPFPEAVEPGSLPVPGFVDLGDGFLLRAQIARTRGAGRASRWTAYVKRSSIGDRATVRTRRRGDRFMPSGMVDEKKLQDFFVDGKVPRTWRDRVPLIVGKQGIAWVVGYRVAEWARAAETGAAIRLYVVRPKGTRPNGTSLKDTPGRS